jgi:hypothetical protein
MPLVDEAVVISSVPIDVLELDEVPGIAEVMLLAIEEVVELDMLGSSELDITGTSELVIEGSLVAGTQDVIEGPLVVETQDVGMTQEEGIMLVGSEVIAGTESV